MAKNASGKILKKKSMVTDLAAGVNLLIEKLMKPKQAATKSEIVKFTFTKGVLFTSPGVITELRINE